MKTTNLMESPTEVPLPALTNAAYRQKAMEYGGAALAAGARHKEINRRIGKAMVTDGVTQMGMDVLRTEQAKANEDRLYFAQMATYFAIMEANTK